MKIENLEELKQCNSCPNSYPLKDFREFPPNRRPIKHNCCSICRKKKQKEKRDANKELLNSQARERYNKNKENISIKRKQKKAQETPEETEIRKQRARVAAARRKDKKNAKERERYYADIEKSREYGRNKRLKRTPEQIAAKKEKDAARFQRDKEKIYARRTAKRHADPQTRIAERLRSSLWLALAGKVKKTNSALRLLGCSLEDFKKYIENQWDENMSWQNWGHGEGKWNIDHIQCIASFELEDVSQQAICFHYKNMRPMWHEDNRQKWDWIEVDGKKVRASVWKRQLEE